MGMMSTSRERDLHKLEATKQIPEGHRFHGALGVTQETSVARYVSSLSPGQIATEELHDREIILVPASVLGLRVRDISTDTVATSTEYYSRGVYYGVLSKPKV